jgi:hypothetical protein
LVLRKMKPQGSQLRSGENLRDAIFKLAGEMGQLSAEGDGGFLRCFWLKRRSSHRAEEAPAVLPDAAPDRQKRAPHHLHRIVAV